MRGRGGSRTAGLSNCDDPGLEKAVLGRLRWEGQCGAGLICDEGEGEEGREEGAGRIKRKRRKKATRQRKRHRGSERVLFLMGCTGKDKTVDLWMENTDSPYRCR